MVSLIELLDDSKYVYILPLLEEKVRISYDDVKCGHVYNQHIFKIIERYDRYIINYLNDGAYVIVCDVEAMFIDVYKCVNLIEDNNKELVDMIEEKKKYKYMYIKRMSIL